MAAQRRQPHAGLVHHTDRDCRYARAAYQITLRHLGLVPSMSCRGNGWDNAVAESFFATLEKDRLAPAPLAPRAVIRKAIVNYIEHYYTTRRRHAYLDYATPLEYELRSAA